MTEYAYDPAYPYVVESKDTGYSVARFANPTAANNYVRGSEALSVIDTTPRLKIPEDEYKALKDAIGYDLVPLSIRNHPEIRFEYRTTADRDGLIERILAAGFRLPKTQGDSDAR